MRDVENISILIKTFERQDALQALLSSIRSTRYRHCPIMIVDDSREPYRDAILAGYDDMVDDYTVLPFDTGLSQGRNELLQKVETEYFVLNDDDFIFDERTDLRWMRDIVASHELDLLGGLFYDQVGYIPSPDSSLLRRAWYRLLRNLGRTRERLRVYHGMLKVTGDTLLMQPIEADHPFSRCDYTHNFFLARTATVRQKVGGWDPEIKIRGHWEFFYRAKLNRLRVATTEAVGVKHHPVENSRLYKHFRNDRGDRFETLALERHGLTRKKWLATACDTPEWKEFSAV
jgi:glycosyltransferase involved in cell wall biosynthesis